MRISENFDRAEFACQCGCGFDVVDTELVNTLEITRQHFNHQPIEITSGCRCEKHNRTIGGSKHSQHRFGKAVDFKVKNIHADQVADYLEKKYPGRYGIGRYMERTHLDIRETPARWDQR